jgi:hypothetical protein
MSTGVPPVRRFRERGEHHHSVCSLSGDVCACPAFYEGERGPALAKACPRMNPAGVYSNRGLARNLDNNYLTHPIGMMEISLYAENFISKLGIVK